MKSIRKLLGILLAVILISAFTGNIIVQASENEIEGKWQNIEAQSDVVPVFFDNDVSAQKYISIVKDTDFVLSYEDAMKYYDANKRCIDLSDVSIEDLKFIKAFEDANYDDVTVSLPKTQSSRATKTTIRSVVLYKNGIQKLNCDVVFTDSGEAFTSVKKITSYLTGFTLGNEWVQKSSSSVITEGGKTAEIQINGVMEHYILINSDYTKVSSEKHTYKHKFKY